MTAKRTTEVRCAQAPSPSGHYAQAVLHGDTLYVSGQLGVPRGTPDSTCVSIADQMRFALGNIASISRVVGANASDVIRCTIYIADIKLWDEANRAYEAFFGTHRPARSIVPCGQLHYNALIEIDAVVAAGSQII